MQKIALGSAQFGMPYGIANRSGQVSIDEIAMIINDARESGINTLDTAMNYGESESVLGKIGIDQWDVITKLPAVPLGINDINSWINRSITASLRRLKIDKLRGLLLHYPEQLLSQDGDEIYSVLDKLKNEGVISKIGISIYDPKELEELIPRYPLEIVQLPFNIIDQRLISSGWLTKLAKKNIEVHVRSIFLQGLLLMGASERPVAFNRWASHWAYWDQWLSNTKLSALQVCLRYVLSKCEISRVIVGVDNLQHLREALCAAEGSVPEIPPELCSNDLDLINPSQWNLT